jgi:hypothetical protein
MENTFWGGGRHQADLVVLSVAMEPRHLGDGGSFSHASKDGFIAPLHANIAPGDTMTQNSSAATAEKTVQECITGRSCLQGRQLSERGDA